MKNLFTNLFILLALVFCLYWGFQGYLFYSESVVAHHFGIHKYHEYRVNYVKSKKAIEKYCRPKYFDANLFYYPESKYKYRAICEVHAKRMRRLERTVWWGFRYSY